MVARAGGRDFSRVVPALQRGHNRLSEEQAAEVVRLYQAGETATELGKRFGIERSTVSRHITRAGITLRSTARSDDARCQGARLYTEGLTVQEVADKLGIIFSATYRALKREGVEMRPAARRRRGM